MRTTFRLCLTAGLLLGGAWAASPRLRAADAGNTEAEQLFKTVLKKAGPLTDVDLLDFFRKRTLSEADLKRIAPLIRQLGATAFRTRVQAQKDLLLLGPPALGELRRALEATSKSGKDSDLEIYNRVRTCIEILTNKPGPALPLAALRLVQARRPANATAVLLAYLPFADNKEVEEEALDALYEVAVKNGKADAPLMAALKDRLPLRRAAAAYLLGRTGELVYRPAVRQRLGDPDAGVRRRAVLGLIGKETYVASEVRDSKDVALLKGEKIATDDAGLLAFFRKRTFSEQELERLHGLVRDLGSKVFRVRNKASQELTQLGSAALPLLRPALVNPDVEIVSRARKCIEQIEKGPATALPRAAARLLSRRPAPEALKVLLAYVPFADDDLVEQEVLTALCVLCTRDVKLSPAVTGALSDTKPARRAAAAYVLGRVGTATDAHLVDKLVADQYPKVRFRAAQVLLAEKDKKAIPVLVALLDDGPLEVARMAENVLADVTGVAASEVELAAAPATRRKVHDAWLAWWKTNEAKFSLDKPQADSLVVRSQRARKVVQKCLNSFLKLDVTAFKKTMKFPVYMEGMAGPGNSLIRKPEEFDQFFKRFEGVPEAKEQLKRMSFKVARVGLLDEYVKLAVDREKNFLKRFRNPEIAIVYIKLEMKGQPQMGKEEAALFVQTSAGRAWVVGFGNPQQGRRMKKK